MTADVARSVQVAVVQQVMPVGDAAGNRAHLAGLVEEHREVDLMVVVGGRSSANTKELTRLCGIVGAQAIQIESVRDLTDAGAFKGARIVGVTGGTSTPIEDLHAVAERILEIAGTPAARKNATALADAAFALAATPAGRTTSIPNTLSAAS